MEKVVLSNGHEFECVEFDVPYSESAATIKFLPGKYTVDELVEMWDNNEEIRVINDKNELLHTYKYFTICKMLGFVPGSIIGSKTVCPSCGKDVAPNALECPECKAKFDVANVEYITQTVCECHLLQPDLHERLAHAEEVIESLINTILG